MKVRNKTEVPGWFACDYAINDAVEVSTNAYKSKNKKSEIYGVI